MLDALTSDLRFAVRKLARAPGFTWTSGALLAVALGGSTALYSLLATVVLAPPAYPDPATLAVPYLTSRDGAIAMGERAQFSWPKFSRFVAEQNVFASLAVYSAESFNLAGDGAAERVVGEYATPEYLSILGARPVVGRLFSTASEGTPGIAPVVLLSEGLWRRRYAADPNVVGRTIRLGRHDATVLGVVDREFEPLSGEAALWVPVAAVPTMMYPEALDELYFHWLDAIARVRPGLAPGELEAGVAAAGDAVARAFAAPDGADDGAIWSAATRSLADVRRDPGLRRALVALFAAVLLVLAIACANVAGLALARGGAEAREVALRSALGASPRRLVGEPLLRGLVLAAGACAAGIALAQAIRRALVAAAPSALDAWGIAGSDVARLSRSRLDLGVVLFAVGAALASALAIGWIPARFARRADLLAGLRAGAPALVGASRQRHRARRALVVGQMAATVVLLVAASLLLRSLGALFAVDLGFEPGRTVTARLTPADGELDRPAAIALHAAMVERLAAIPGVAAVAVGSCLPATGAGGCSETVVTRLDGREIEPTELLTVGYRVVGAGFFDVLGIPLVAGREFSAEDVAGGPRVAILSAATARALWPGLDPLGRELALGMGGFGDTAQAVVVGVANDVVYASPEVAPTPVVYLPDGQVGNPATHLIVRAERDTSAAMAALRAVGTEIAPTIPLVGLRTLDEQIARSVSRTRFVGALLAITAALALVLGAVGVFGLLAQAVGEREREIGLRIALGAAPRDVVLPIVGEGARLAAFGIALGLPLAFAVSATLASLLYGVGPGDWVALVGGPAILAIAAALAAWLPARRAAWVEPAVALRGD